MYFASLKIFICCLWQERSEVSFLPTTRLRWGLECTANLWILDSCAKSHSFAKSWAEWQGTLITAAFRRTEKMKGKQKNIWPCWPYSCSGVHLIKSPSFLYSGINEQGLYRIVGVNSRVQKLLSVLMGECSSGFARQVPWAAYSKISNLLGSLWSRNQDMQILMPRNLPCFLVVAVGMNSRGSEWAFARLKWNVRTKHHTQASDSSPQPNCCFISHVTVTPYSVFNSSWLFLSSLEAGIQ